MTSGSGVVQEALAERPPEAGPSVGAPALPRAGRLLFIDNLRILVIALVVIVHVAIVYGGLAADADAVAADALSSGVLLWLGLTAQAFAMGLLFAIAGYFTPGAYDRRGAWGFVRSRLLHLGVPLLFYDLVINPLIVFAATAGRQGAPLSTFVASYPSFITGVGTGPTWFLLNLLLFDLGYVLWRHLRPAPPPPAGSATAPPAGRALVAYTLLLAVATYVVRLAFPVGWGGFFSLRLPYYPAYVSAFVIGALAWRRGWLAHLSDRLGRGWLAIGAVAALLFPALLFSGEFGALMGGPSPRALLFALWEALVFVGLGVGLLWLFRRRVNRQGALAAELSASAYAVYLLHVPVIALLNRGLLPLGLYPLLGFALASASALPLCVLIGALARRLPLVRRVL
jgi:fucose 4-O-acetylase-like acetyltransferase